MNWIDYRELPNVGGISELFKDFISEFNKVKKYYEFVYHDWENFGLRRDIIHSEYKLRREINKILLRQNKNFACDKETFSNISKLENDNTYAVVTGQQVGILTGPLYTIYKIITLLKFTSQLQKRNPDFNYVPIFWLESEDHDFEEMNKINVLDKDNHLTTIDYISEKKIDQHGPIGSYVLGKPIENFIDKLSNILTNSEYKDTLIENIANIYTQDSTFETAFVRWVNFLFPNCGIIFISPNDKEIKLLLSNIFVKEITEHPKTSQLVIQKSAELEENYHAQLKPHALNLFMFYKGGRYLIEPRENDFCLKGTRKRFSKEELLQIAIYSPELLSPNVVLRPICQDTLLPTLAYIAGQSEIAYFAQLKNVYKNFELTLPIIYPRSSVTILEEKIIKILEKYELPVHAIFEGKEQVMERVLDFVSEVKIDQLFTTYNKQIDEMLNEMKFGLSFIDQTLLGALETTRGKIKDSLRLLKDKTLVAQNRKYEVAIKQVEKALNHIFPFENMQERELNITYYLSKYGPDFQQSLLKEIDIKKFKHQTIELK